ncbi:2'-5' RNA ligase family protein [Streptomyces sp. UNOC14_S4]|uniref:2'-5' RNA ligase family protein n=1 Tax=Streptomyces sp. UNOC14_S4 TaxID=2872340 RepID=UPI001E652007|nr:2'-5' RNA ligase family protein [Streptomyces sp. UNOC14_S4]
MSTRPAHMLNHWWWRPGWREGRRIYTWHFTFRGAAQVHRLAAEYRQALHGVPGLDLVPDRWLHLTMQGLGFVDEVAEKDVRAIVEAVSARLRAVSAFELTLDRPEITPEAIRWEAYPARPPATVRREIREAIAEVWGTAPEAAEGFAPHVSIAYSAADGPAQPVAQALRRVEPEPATVTLGSVELIVLGRDRRMYEWEEYARVPLG